jgi:hypothetical protein
LPVAYKENFNRKETPIFSERNKKSVESEKKQREEPGDLKCNDLKGVL